MAGNFAPGCYTVAVLRPLLFLALGATLGACSEPGPTDISIAAASEPEREKKMPRAQAKSFDGWGPFTFGMDLSDALTAHSGVVWDPKSVGKCRAEMPTKGCTLNPALESRVPRTAGVALLPTIIVNQKGKLAAIRLHGFLKENIQPAECGRAYDQLLKHLRDTWGSPMARSSNKHGMLVNKETFQVQPDGRKIILLSRYIGATEAAAAVCYLSIEYRGPERLQPPPEERPHPLKNWH